MRPIQGVARRIPGISMALQSAGIPDETTILNFHCLLEKHELAPGILGVINGYQGDRSLSHDRLHGVSEA
jgi:transposase, IS5 family